MVLFLPRKILVTAVLATAICAAINFLAPLLLYALRYSDFEQLGSSLVYGVLTGQLVFLATWAALGEGRPMVRVPLATGVFLVMNALLLASFWITGITFEDLAMILMIQLTSFVIMQTPLWSLRGIWGYRLTRPTPQVFSLKTERTQFGLLQLLVLTALVAVTLGVLRLVIPAIGLNLSGLNDVYIWIELLLFFAITVLFTGSVALPAIWLMMATRRRVLAGVLLLSSMTILPLMLLVCVATAQDIPLHHFLRDFSYLALFGAGLLIFLCSGLFILRWHGYRLLSPADLEKEIQRYQMLEPRTE